MPLPLGIPSLDVIICVGLDPRKIQSARFEKKSIEFYLAHKCPDKPAKSSFISMTGVPPIFSGSKVWGEENLPTEAAERDKNAWRDPYVSLSGLNHPPSSKKGYYRCVRVDKSNIRASSKGARPATTSSSQRPTAARGERHSSLVKTRPSTASLITSSSINPLLKVESLRLQGLVSAEGGGLFQPGTDIRGPRPEIGCYPQPSSQLKKVRQDVAQGSKPCFKTYGRPLVPGHVGDYQTLLGGGKATIPIQFWQEPAAVRGAAS